MNPDEVLFELKAMIDCTLRIGQNRERRFERLLIDGMLDVTWSTL